MIRSQWIFQKIKELLHESGTKDVFRIAEELGIVVCYRHDFQKLLGMYVYKWRHRYIFLNDKMCETLRKIVMAHEIGHDMLHRSIATHGIREFNLFDVKSITEYEANVVAAHLLLDTEQVYFLAKEGYSIFQISQKMETELDLMLIKMQEMVRMGYNLSLPEVPKGDFLIQKNIE